MVLPVTCHRALVSLQAVPALLVVVVPLAQIRKSTKAFDTLVKL
jgi:hypothetical protein